MSDLRERLKNYRSRWDNDFVFPESFLVKRLEKMIDRYPHTSPKIMEALESGNQKEIRYHVAGEMHEVRRDKEFLNYLKSEKEKLLLWNMSIENRKWSNEYLDYFIEYVERFPYVKPYVPKETVSYGSWWPWH